jgi:hypothetical protein
MQRSTPGVRTTAVSTQFSAGYPSRAGERLAGWVGLTKDPEQR